MFISPPSRLLRIRFQTLQLYSEATLTHISLPGRRAAQTRSDASQHPVWSEERWTNTQPNNAPLNQNERCGLFETPRGSRQESTALLAPQPMGHVTGSQSCSLARGLTSKTHCAAAGPGAASRKRFVDSLLGHCRFFAAIASTRNWVINKLSHFLAAKQGGLHHPHPLNPQLGVAGETAPSTTPIESTRGLDTINIIHNKYCAFFSFGVQKGGQDSAHGSSVTSDKERLAHKIVKPGFALRVASWKVLDLCRNPGRGPDILMPHIVKRSEF